LAEKTARQKLEISEALNMLRFAKQPKTSTGQNSGNIQNNGISKMISEGGKSFLLKIKHRALRANNSWYRALSIDKRRFIDAVIQTVDKIRSSLLLKILTKFVTKLVDAVGGVRALIGPLAYGMQTFGRLLAQRISNIASNWANKQSQTWSNDTGFIRFLTVLEMSNC
jgi:hypothetical protein